ncbi:GNAT family N-acetyltransferase [Marinomonas sp. C2222]|uniref:GNAT family N-acetyltransferase n=1 Tax=Marinomonas sargassi TaxID=2984494 RepID=A0ABT2YTK0_9GAMM|nr:GNAT family N-acetyltransferase [Marinomonas sargassi]MCV2403196.1 GNAT family N-acetyltransferase [Marinomonas sargassi]
MNIEVYEEEITPDLMNLLLSADPDKKAILSYLSGALVLVCKDGDIFVSIAVLINSAGAFELKNLAVLKPYQGLGIAKSMIQKSKQIAKEAGAKMMEVGTGNSSFSQLALYQKCGFRMHSIEPNFFKSYPEPIIENGVRCIDMVRLRVEL